MIPLLAGLAGLAVLCNPRRKRRNPGRRRAKAHKRILGKWHKARRLIGKYSWNSALGRKKLAQREKLRRFAFRSGIRGSLLFSTTRRRNPSPAGVEKLLHGIWKKHYAYTSPTRHKQSNKADRIVSRLLAQMPAGRKRNYITRKFQTRGFRGQAPEILPLMRTLECEWLPTRPALRAYDDGSTWNGWAEPMVTEIQLRRIAKVFNKNADEIRADQGTLFEKRKDGWYEVIYEGGKVDRENTRKLDFNTYRTANGPKKLANIGCGLTWEWKDKK
jgi:hypothetical protein